MPVHAIVAEHATLRMIFDSGGSSGGAIGAIAPLETVWGGILSATGAQNATPNVQTKFSSAERAITIIKEP